jgi:hypothetical protein
VAGEAALQAGDDVDGAVGVVDAEVAMMWVVLVGPVSCPWHWR